MLFQQTAAPPGWTKQVLLNDYGLRVVSGTAGKTAGSAFSSVFAQTAVGNTTITQATMPSHTHGLGGSAIDGIVPTGNAISNSSPGGAFGIGGISINSTGSDGAHAHSINLTLSYVDVIIAVKN